MLVAAPSPEQVDRALGLIVDRQAAPVTACAYLGTTPDGIRAELDDIEIPWRETLRVAVDDSADVVGAVLVDWDEETGRSWVHGPWTRDEAMWDEVADALLDAAVTLTPATVQDHEVSAAPEHERLAELATSRGWIASEVNYVYVARSADGWPDAPATVRPAVDGDLEAVTVIHEEAFPGTYATARRLLSDPERVTLVLTELTELADSGRSTGGAGWVLGYASAEIQADGDGYLDFIALSPGARGRGLGAGLLSAIGRAVLAASPNGCVNLTVKESNAPAVRLYERFGYAREAELVGYRSRPTD
ncbi:GNAT family N-acetyltransferase [Nostocoides sp. F2B08]|uniref:GNAT family N-acetyltransferase n=1 Tax=Nostocoides sp. F2B08 TaxID=2653936 RepID=UPI001262EAD5|nr:GNAT family N-acetyltransferase [Tetrasphaera sp. F2B08]KAB7744011.1 GNAT family N-acetyltransferase [Tetrasphaera sp. F2B08]